MADAPLGPRQFPLKGMNDEDFEELCHRLVLVDHPDAIHPAAPDGGVDSLVPAPDGGNPEGFQAKHYPGHIHWTHCKDSLDQAVKSHEISSLTFCFPRDLTANQLKKFKTDLVDRHSGVSVRLWDASQIDSRLAGSDEGLRVARHYFGDPVHEKEQMLRTVRAGGDLETGSDAMERARSVGEFLQGHDPFFTYSQVSHEAGGTNAPRAAPGSMMSVATTEDGLTVRIDAVPRHSEIPDEHTPHLAVGFTDDEEGRAAAKRFTEAMDANRPVQIDRGITITPTNLPPLFQDQVGKDLGSGTLQVTPLTKRVPAWTAELSAADAQGSVSMVVHLEPLPHAPPEWDFGLEGVAAGLTVGAVGRWRDGSGEVRFTWSYRFDPAAPKDLQVRALRLVLAAGSGEEVSIRDVSGGRPEVRQKPDATETDPQFSALLALIEDLVVIEEWTSDQIDIPETITPEDAAAIARAAAFIRSRRVPITFQSVEANVTPGQIDEKLSKHALVIEQSIGVRIFGEEHWLGRMRTAMDGVEAKDLGPATDDPEKRTVQFAFPEGGVQLEASLTAGTVEQSE